MDAEYLVCGVEEPLQSNEMLHAVDERTGENLLAEFCCPEAARYSFVWIGGAATGAERLNEIFYRVAARAGAPVSLLCCCTIVEPDGSRLPAFQQTRSHWIEQLGAEQGWDLHHGPHLTLALRQRQPTTLRVGTLWYDYSSPHSGLESSSVAVFGEVCAPDLLSAPPATLRSLGFGRSGRPSKEFLEWMGERNLAVAYRLTDELGRPGAVLAGKIRVDVADLVERGLVQKTHTGTEAYRTWWYGPGAGA